MKNMLASVLTVAALMFADMAFAQQSPGDDPIVKAGVHDPGVRGVTVDAGQPLASFVNENQTPGGAEFFKRSLENFKAVEVVQGGTDNGLGPRFNERSCVICHSQPAVGGGSPSTTDFPFVGPNPQSTVVGDCTHGAVACNNTNTTPSFVLANGPVREARFPFFFDANGNPNPNDPNGGVEDLFTIAGRPDALTCVAGTLQQPSFAQAQATNNIIFRTPLPLFGDGLIDNVDDSFLLTNLRNNAGNAFGIGGTFNRNGNDGTITHFGHKAQNKSLLLFAGEAYNVEMGITNELFQQERPLPGEGRTTGLPAACRVNPTPEDTTNFVVATVAGSETNPQLQAQQNANVPSDIERFAIFMRFLAPPTPNPAHVAGATTASINNGANVFAQIGCAVCHTATLHTSPSSETNDLSNVDFHPFGDVAIHHMGVNLADNVTQGNAGGDQFRTAFLWGVGQRIFFLHDGRSRTLQDAIAQHESTNSEATITVENFEALSAQSQQDVLNFLRSL
jgi:CxxC motif-containing protein (DUF1111 family)